MQNLKVKYLDSLCDFIGVNTYSDYERYTKFPDWNFIHKVWDRFRDLTFTEHKDREIHLDYRIVIQNDIVNTKDGTVNNTIKSLGEAVEWYNGIIK